MFTVCPKCALTLVVTAADLRVAQGYVRCGRCLNVFNALARLSEDRPGAAPEPQQQTSPAGSPEQAAPPESLAPSIDDTGEIEVELDAASVLVTSVRAPTAPREIAKPEAQADSPNAGVSAMPAAPDTSDSAPAATAVARAQPTSATPSVPARHDAASTSSPLAKEPSPSPHVTREPVAPAESAPPSSAAEASAEASEGQQTNTSQQRPEGAIELETQRPRAGLAWKLGTGALVIALAIQIVNHYRDSLAANPALTGPLSAVYSTLGVKLAPRWDIHAYDVRQLGASVADAAAGEIVVRASVKNSASRAQPLPLLRVILQDRFGNRIAARDVPPGNYLPSSVAPSSLLPAGSRVDATMVFVDPGPQAVGFEIDACLRERSGEVACAHGP